MSGAVTAAVIGGTIAAGAGIAGSAIQASAAGKAADTQATAAQQAAEYQKQAGQQALQYQQQQNQQTQQNLNPYMQAGTGALSNLSYLLGVGGQNAGQTPYQPSGQPQTAQVGNTSTQIYSPNGTQPINAQSGVQAAQPGAMSYSPNSAQPSVQDPTLAGMITPGAGTQNFGNPSSAPNASGGTATGGYGSLLTPYQDFSAPTGLTMENDPGYQARLKLGTDVLEHSAAARGNVLTGGTAKALDTYAQDYASNEYGNVYNRALSGYTTNRDTYNTGQNNTYNRLMGLVSGGESAATNASALGQSGANSVANTLTGNAAAVNQQNNNAAAASASGYASQGNIWGSAVNGVGSNLGNLYALQNQGNPYQTLYNAQNPNTSNVSTMPSYLPYIS
jgi:hypothetical protein